MEDVSVIISTNFAASCFQVPSSTSLTPADISSGWSSRQTSYGYRNASWTVSEHWNSSQLQHPFTVHVVLLSSGKAYLLLNLNLFCIHLPVALPWQSCASVSYQSHCGLVHDTDIATFSYSIGWNDLNQLLFAYVCDLFFGQNAYLFRFHWDLNH